MTENGADSRIRAKNFATKSEICLFPKNLV